MPSHRSTTNRSRGSSDDTLGTPVPPTEGLGNAVLFEAVFGHFLVNVALTADAAEELNRLDLGRIHNRLLVVIAGLPGITVGELTRILGVTHQNIRVPMKNLIERDLLVAERGVEDRREVLLTVTPAGRELVLRTLGRQFERIGRAFEAAGPEATRNFLAVQRELLDEDRGEYLSRLRGGIRACLPIREARL